MEATEYEGLVRRLEIEALSGPTAFQAKVMLISGVAYVALFLALILLAGLAGYGFDLARQGANPWIALKLLLTGAALTGLLFAVLRAFLTPIPPPEGHEITAAEAPRLFHLLERIRHQLGGPPLDRVVVDQSFNAAIAQVPRFGLFGGHRNHLILGLPFLYAMSTREMAATLAHEYGHVAGAHGKLSAWVYRQRITFGALVDKLRQKRNAGPLDRALLGAVERFAPWFSAYTFVLSRQDEYDADAASARVTGAPALASGLCRAELLGSWISDTFWPALHAHAQAHAAPPQPPFRAMPAAFAAAYPEWATPKRLRRAKRVRSGLDDTHPCLQDRLSAIGEAAELPPAVATSAAETLLGPLAQRLAAEFDAAWWRVEQKNWQARHRRYTENRRTVSQLGEVPLDKLDAVQLHELGRALAEEGRADHARAVLDHLLARPDGPFPRAHLLLGRLLLRDGDDKGLDHLRRAAAGDGRLVEECARRGSEFLVRSQGEMAAAVWAEELVGAPAI